MGRNLMRNPRFKNIVATAKRRWIISITLGLVALVLLIQIFYPSNYTVPFAKVAGNYHGFTSDIEIEKLLQSKFIDSKVGISVAGDVEKVNVAKIGASLDLEETTESVLEYPLSLRIIPFSFIFYSPDVDEFSLDFDRDRLKEFSLEFSTNHSLESKSASVKLIDGEISVESSEKGYAINPSKLIDKIESQEYTLSETSSFAAPLDFIAPEVTDAEVEGARALLEAALNKQIVISKDDTGQQIVPAKDVVATWLSVNKSEDGSIAVVLNSDQISSYLTELNKQVGNSPEPVKVIFKDGREVERNGGSPGIGVDQDKFIADIQNTLFTPAAYGYVSLALKEIPAPEQAVYTYTNSQDGLAAKLDELTKRYNAKISVKQLSGGGWSANSKGSETWPSASTYKLYVAAMLFSKIESGEIKWSDEILGRNVSSCFESMIVVSTNECAEEWLRRFGRSNLENYIYQHGISDATRFTDAGPARTSANDLVRILEGFYKGSLASGENTNKLMDAMSRQVWRKGIPSGTTGSVTDKVGFLWDYTHDSGIVRHSRGTYILAVMTKGHNYGTISQITKEIEQVMYP